MNDFLAVPPKTVLERELNNPASPSRVSLSATYEPKGAAVTAIQAAVGSTVAPAKSDPFRYDSTRLRAFRSALAKRETTPVDCLFITDSIGEGQGMSGTDPFAGKRWADRLKVLMRKEWQPTGVTGGYGYATSALGLSGYTNPTTYTGTGTNGVQSSSGLSLLRVALSAGQVVNKYFTGTGVDIVFMRNSQGTDVTWEIDSGTRTTFNTYAAASKSGEVIQIRGLTPGQHLVTLRVVGPNNFYFNGFMEYNGDETKGIRTWIGGRSGYRSSDFLVAGASDRLHEDYGMIQPDLVTIALGTNDFVSGTGKIAPAATAANLATMIAAIRAKCTVPPSFILWQPAEVKNVAGALAPWSEYLTAIENVAKADGAVTLFDAYTLMGDQAANTYGLLTADKIHPNDDGYVALADRMFALLRAA